MPKLEPLPNTAPTSDPFTKPRILPQTMDEVKEEPKSTTLGPLPDIHATPEEGRSAALWAQDKAANSSELPNIHGPPSESKGTGPSRIATLHPSLSGNKGIQSEIDDLFGALGVQRGLGLETGFGALQKKPEFAGMDQQHKLLEYYTKHSTDDALPERLPPQPLKRGTGGYQVDKLNT